MPREVQKMAFAVLIFSEGFGLCDQTNAIYQADVYAENKIMKYYGSTKRQFKKRYSQHKSSFREIPKCHTTLSSHIWKLKDKSIPYEVKWSIKARGTCFLKWRPSMRPVPHWKTCNSNCRPKHNVEQKRWITWIL